jgi:O-antigen/teichoic acid export membrane protein
MKKNTVIHNAATSMLQIVVSGLTLIVLYKVLIRLIGIEQLGIWSLVLATTSMAQLAAMGITGSIVKYVAQYGASGESGKIALLIETAAISIAVIFVLVLAAAYPLAGQYLNYALPSGLRQAAVAILPHALAAYWIAMLTSVFQAGLYGSQRISWRNYLLMADSVCYLVLCYFVAGSYGLVGLAWARVIQNLLSLVTSWVLLRKSVPGLRPLPRRWDRGVFREIIGYSMNFQVISLLALLCDPLTKGLLSRFGSASQVGYYEMANRLVQQFRSLIVSANQVLIPAFAQLKELDPERIRSVYLRSYRLLFFISVPVFSLLAVGAPLVSELWIGSRQPGFIQALLILSAGWFVNTLCVPAYYAGMGTGELRWNVISHCLMAALNVCLGYALGLRFGGAGVVTGWAIALALAGVLLGVSFHREQGLSLREFMPQGSRWLTAWCLAGLLGCYFSFGSLASAGRPVWGSAGLLACFCALVALPVWRNPLRRELTGWLAGLYQKKAVAS